MSSVRSNLHTHTTFSDGHSSPEEYVLSAIRKEFVSIGFSEHAYTPYDSDCCILESRIMKYHQEISRLKDVYRDRIEIYLGWEGDYYYPTPTAETDFTIGSVHYLLDERTGRYYTIDHLTHIFEEAVRVIGGGNVQSLVERYYAAVEDLVNNQNHDIVGHMDLITKLNRSNCYFDAQSQWYREAYRRVCRAAADRGKIVELNTGGLFRGYTLEPYPNREILTELCELKVPVILSSDAHHVDGLDYWFEEAVILLRDIGFSSVRQMQGGQFVEVSL